MKKRTQAVIALILVLCLTLSGCSGVDFGGYFEQMFSLLLGTYISAFDSMEYVRPDMQELEAIVDDCCQRAEQAKNLEELVAIIYEAYAPLDQFATAYALANIHYSIDLTDTYWGEEYEFCSQQAAIAQAALDRFYRVLAKTPFLETLEGPDYFGAGFFDDYQGDSIYDQTFTELLTREAELESQYYTLYSDLAETDPDGFAQQASQLMVELVTVRQEMATYLGYESYPEFAYDFYYDRDYTCQQTTAYLADIRVELVPLYLQMVTEGLDITLNTSTESETLAYVREMAYNMGGIMEEAYDQMVKNGLYDVGPGINKFNASFEIYISNYNAPFIFMNPTMSERDQLTLAHEFGHFCCDYASYGSGAGVDVSEVFSQGMEYLSLCYVQGNGTLERLKMADSLSVFVEQAAYASFEQQLYGLTGEALTAENIQALFGQVSAAYGLDSWGLQGTDFVQITHFYISPMYVISYVVSNDVAMQMYEMEQTEAGSGLACLEGNLTTLHSGIVAFAQEAGLVSPFAPSRITQVKQILQAVLDK